MAGANKEQLTRVLIWQAMALFGEERSEELRSSLEERAEQLWILDQAQLNSEEEPAIMFFPWRWG
jgi:hypothetical protein